MGNVTNFPNGFTGDVTLRALALMSTYSRKLLWVDSNGTQNGEGTFQRPYATIQQAVDACDDDKGDIIIVKAGHLETVAAAAGLALDKTGVTIIGLGNGTNRPQINFTGTAATMTVTAANVDMSGIYFTGGIDAVVSAIVVSAAGFTLHAFEYRDVTGQCTDFLLTTAAADNMHVFNFVYNGAAAAGTNAAIAIVGGDGIAIHDFVMDGNFAVGGIDVRTTATTDLKVFNVASFRTRNAADIFLIDTITASTGQIGPDINIRVEDDAANITEAITGATFHFFDPIWVCNAVDERGLQIDKSISTDA